MTWGRVNYQQKFFSKVNYSFKLHMQSTRIYGFIHMEILSTNNVVDKQKNETQCTIVLY